MPQQHHLAKYGLTGCLRYSGPALSIHVKPAGGDSQNGLMVDGETYRLDNSETYNITSHSMTVNLYNDRMKKGKAVGRWWISIQATNATITSGNVATIPNPQSAITNYYVWGLDLSGTLQGAGGIGGLLCVSQSGTGVSPVSFFPLADGNGNITDYISTNGVVVAHREYDPFGGTIALTGNKKDDFNFWFSTKYWDTETGKGYWGHRYYDPVTGRWLSRDPIGEIYRFPQVHLGNHAASGRFFSDMLSSGLAETISVAYFAQFLTAQLGFEAREAHTEARVLREIFIAGSIHPRWKEISHLERELESFLNSALLAEVPRESEVDLYTMCLNDPVAKIDSYGLAIRAALRCDARRSGSPCHKRGMRDGSDCTPAGAPAMSMTCQAVPGTGGWGYATCMCKCAK